MKKLSLLSVALMAVGSIGSSNAADLPARMTTLAPVPYLNWTGFYAGVNAGFGWGDPSSHLVTGPLAGFAADPLAPADYNTRMSGFIGGAQAGYNYQINTVVVGVETDIQFSNINGTMTTPSTFLPALVSPATFTESETLSWFGTARGRIGFLPMSNLLLYGTGGLAYGRVNTTSLFHFDTAPFVAYSGSAAQTKAGWTLGGGAEWALDRSWSVKAEYLYYDLGTINVTGLPPVLGPIPFATQLSQKVTGSIAKFGVNFMFGN